MFTNFLQVTWNSLKGLYLCTFGYFKGDYAPNLYNEWKKAKKDFNNEFFQADELNYLLEKGVKHLKGENISYREGSLSSNLLENSKFENKSAAYYKKEALEALWDREVEKDIVEKMASIEEIYERGLEKVMPELRVCDSSRLEETFPKLLKSAYIESIDNPDMESLDTFQYLLKKLISEEQKIKKMQDMLRTVLSPEDLEKALAIEKSTGIDKPNEAVFQNILENLPVEVTHSYSGKLEDMFYSVDGIDRLVNDF